MKANRRHRVPLGGRALEIVEAAQAWRRLAGESNGPFSVSGNPADLKPARFLRS